MGRAQLAFEGVLWGGATGSHVTESDVTGSYVTGMTSVTWPEVTSVRCPVRRYVLRMRSRAFWPEVTSVTWLEEALSEVALTGNRFCACPGFSRAFFLVVVPWLADVTEGLLTPFGFPWVCATGSCATPVVVVNNVGWGCSLWRPRPIIIGNPASYI